MNEFIGALEKYADFEGRSTRKEYWMFYLFFLLSTILFYGVIPSMLDANAKHVFLYVSIGCTLLLFIPHISLLVRRLHDIGLSGLYALLAFIPFIGVFVLLIFCLMDSQPKDNIYGPNPKNIK